MSFVTVGASIKGEYHYKNGTPCQDAHAYKSVGDWDIMVVADGAGSCDKSHLGSKTAVYETQLQTEALVEKYPDLAFGNYEWAIKSSKLFEKVRIRLSRVARKQKIEFEQLSCTLILIVYNQDKLFIAHVGDGRAGAKVNRNWISILDPVQGKEIGSTCFITTSFWKEPGYFQSRVFEGDISSVVAMSDGCEKVAWLIDQLDHKTNKFVNVNRPFGDLLDYCLENIVIPLSSRNGRMKKYFSSFIKEGNQLLKTEPDDRTMVLSHIISP